MNETVSAHEMKIRKRNGLYFWSCSCRTNSLGVPTRARVESMADKHLISRGESPAFTKEN